MINNVGPNKERWRGDFQYVFRVSINSLEMIVPWSFVLTKKKSKQEKKAASILPKYCFLNKKAKAVKQKN